MKAYSLDLRQKILRACDQWLRSRRTIATQHTIARRGARLLHLPPYSPALAPLEPCWSKVKTALRQAKARLREALDMAITEALATVTEADAHGWFRHCGSGVQ